MIQMQKLKQNCKTFLQKTLFVRDVKCLCCDNEMLADSKYCICKNCYDNLPFITRKVCQKCGEPIDSFASFCMRCKKQIDRNFDIARAVFLYKDQLRRLIINLKFFGQKYVAEYLSWFLYDCYVANEFDCDIIVPVPMSTKSLKKRGYNQQQLLCYAFEQSGFDVDTKCIQKTRDTKTQVGLNFAQRQTNLIDAFKVVDRQKVKGKKILIIDDIFTTGATISQVAAALKKAGAKSVFAITLCHEMPENATN